MPKNKEKGKPQEQEAADMQAQQEQQAEEVTEAETPEAETCEAGGEDKAAVFAQALKEKEDQFLRLAAEYDNFRKRSQKEKEAAWSEATSQTVAKFLPVYDNLNRAIRQGSEDADFLKGVEMTMAQLQKVFEALGVKKIDALGQPFDPDQHNAVMHIDDPELGENVVAEVFEEGFTLGEKVIRFAMVKVAN